MEKAGKVMVLTKHAENKEDRRMAIGLFDPGIAQPIVRMDFDRERAASLISNMIGTYEELFEEPFPAAPNQDDA